MVIVLVAVGLAVLAAVALVSAIWGPDAADLFLGVIGFLAWLCSREYSALVDRTGRWLSKRSPKSWYARLAPFLKRIRPAFTYGDLSLILASLILLCVWLYNSFVAGVEDLAARGLLSYDPQMTGFIHLQIYIAGYLSMPPLMLACAAYGFFRGIKDGQVSFAKLLVAISLAVLTAILLLSLVRGGFIGSENLEIVTERTSGAVPSGAEATSPISLLSAGLSTWLGFAGLAWIFGVLGRLAKRLLLRTMIGETTPEAKQGATLGTAGRVPD